LNFLVIRQIISLARVERAQHVEQALNVHCLREHGGLLGRLRRELDWGGFGEGFLAK
jgi:hypothetical protein